MSDPTQLTALRELRESEEIWRSIPDCDEQYEVSDRGNVRLYDEKHQAFHLLAPSKTKYLSVKLLVRGRRRTKSIHVLVCTAFLGSRPQGYHCAHLNGDRQDNRAHNLSWVLPAENERHKIMHGRCARGERQGSSRLTEQAVKDIRKTYRRGNGELLARKFGVSLFTIVAVARRKTWLHVLDDTDHHDGCLITRAEALSPVQEG